MTDWTNVRWTQARQIVALTSKKAAADLPESVTPAEYLAGLRAEGHAEEAVTYLGLALPEYDSIVWAANMLAATPAPVASPEAAAIAAVDIWIERPDDARRHAAWEAGAAADDWSPERLLAHAVFLSGQPRAQLVGLASDHHHELCGRMVASAIIMSAYRSNDKDAAIERALNAGEFAARGSPRQG